MMPNIKYIALMSIMLLPLSLYSQIKSISKYNALEGDIFGREMLLKYESIFQSEDKKRNRSINLFVEKLYANGSYEQKEYFNRKLVENISSNVFSNRSKVLLEREVEVNPSFYTILLAGKQLRSFKKQAIGTNSSSSETKIENFYSKEWAILLAKARMGNKKSLEKIITVFNSEKAMTFKYGKLLRHIAYVNNKDAYDFIKGLIDSEDKVSYSNDEIPIEVVEVDLALRYLPSLFIDIVENYPMDLFLPRSKQELKQYLESESIVFLDTSSGL